MLISHVLAELERERAMREREWLDEGHVFPRLQKDGKLTYLEREARLARLTAGVELCSLLLEHGVATLEELPLRLTSGGRK